MRFLLLLLCGCVLFGCTKQASSPTPGYYTLYFKTENGTIPARLDIRDNGWHIINAEEVILLDSVELRADSFFVKLPLFDSSMKGVWRNDSLIGQWTDHSRVQYSIPFAGVKSMTTGCDDRVEELHYDIVFSPSDSSESRRGIAVLQKSGHLVTGTVLTETGDYRYLQGEIMKDTLWLSAFDGTHLFYLIGRVVGDSIIDGVFLSGKHWKEDWAAVKSTSNTLRDPFSITSIRANTPVRFEVLNATGDSMLFDSSTWKNHVSIIQIMGSWCPNCTDESRFLKTLFEQHASKGLQIIPVAFERGEDITTSCTRVDEQFQQLGLRYPFYYGGKAGKDIALETFPFLTGVHSFPTSIFIDRRGIVRKVYTGFYGPGTGAEYERHTKTIEALVDSLLSE